MELTIDQALRKGIEAHKAGQVQEADRMYTAILKAQPKHPDANHNMGILAVGVGKVEQALPFFKIALEANPAKAQFWLSYIDALIKLDWLEDAKTVLDQAKSKGAKGEGFDKLESKLSAVTESFATDLTTEKMHPNILDSLKLDKALKLAKRKLKDGLEEEVKRIYQDILVKFPENKRARDGIKKLAGRPVSKASKIQDPTQYQLHSLVNLYSQGELQQALKKVETLVMQFSNSPVLFNMHGAILYGLGKRELSVDAYKKAVSIQPNYSEAYYNMGNALKEQGKLEEAIDAYKKAASIQPNYSEAYYNMGNALKEQGKLEEAIDAYKKVLAIQPDYAQAYYNMGNALKEQGKLEEAIDAYKKFLSIHPNYAEAYNNMGLAIKEQGKLEEAIGVYHKALSIKPDYYGAYHNMGNALREKGELEEAIEAYNKTLAIAPDNAETYKNMGITLYEQGKREEAIEAFSKSLAIQPDNVEAYYNMCNALTDHIFSKHNQKIENAIIAILDRKKIVRPSDISRAALSLLKCQRSFKNLVLLELTIKFDHKFQEIIEQLSRTPLLLKMMSVCPLADLDFERLLCSLRTYILQNIAKISVSSSLQKFQSALALQCFTNEYVYNFNESDAEALRELEGIVSTTLANGSQPKPHMILCLASFKALHEYDWSDQLQSNDDLEQVIRRQITEPNEEDVLKSNIELLGEINDDTSSKVREQYEENPYPRWVDLGLNPKPSTISQASKKIKLKLSNEDILSVNTPSILVAGCGTGQHSIETAMNFKDAKVLAIDLSLSSLAYAKRKTQELGIENIDYMQADILQLRSLDRRFDIIESAGVLHHMDDPIAGWEVLVDCLSKGGLMRIGLYSELGRRPVIEYRDWIAQTSLATTKNNIRYLRSKIAESEDDMSKQIRLWADYFSMSELRDLLFHVQEHRFTLSQIKDCLSQLRLEFCGFEQTKIVEAFKVLYPTKDAEYDLDKWQTFEQNNPRIFSGMYQFWCQKIS